jgi:hypothetical protein
MTWRELQAMAEAAGVQPEDEIEVEYRDYSWTSPRISETYPEGVKREYDTLTLTLSPPGEEGT